MGCPLADSAARAALAGIDGGLARLPQYIDDGQGADKDVADLDVIGCGAPAARGRFLDRLRR